MTGSDLTDRLYATSELYGGSDTTDGLLFIEAAQAIEDSERANASAPRHPNELLEAAKEARRVLEIMVRPRDAQDRGLETITVWAQCIEAELKLRTAIRNAEQTGGGG